MNKSGVIIMSIVLAVSLQSAYGQENHIFIDVDKSNYFHGDAIHISGSVDEILFGTEVKLMIIGPNGDVLSIENLPVDKSKQFEMNLPADDEKLKDYGIYTVLARYGSQNEPAKDTFSIEQKNRYIPTDESKKNVLLNFDFVNPSKKYIQEHVDYTVTVSKNGQNVFGPTPLTHSTTGSVSIPINIAERQTHTVLIEVHGVTFQPMPVETSQFTVMTGGQTILSEFTSKNSLKINLALDKNPSPDPDLIPKWVKNSAKWWAEGKIDDKAFVQTIEYLLNENIVEIPDLPYPASWMDKDVPSWVKSNAKWWSEDLLSEDDFIKGIKFLVEKGVIVIDPA